MTVVYSCPVPDMSQSSVADRHQEPRQIAVLLPSVCCYFPPGIEITSRTDPRLTDLQLPGSNQTNLDYQP